MKNDKNSQVGPADLRVLSEDRRLERLLGAGDQACILDLWVLRVKLQATIDSRILYGRASPYDFSSQQWSASPDEPFKQVRAGLLAYCKRITLYCSTTRLRELLQGLMDGASLADASKAADVVLSPVLDTQLGLIGLTKPTCVRPVMHLPARDCYGRSSSRLSVVDDCSCDSGSISSLAKSELLQVGGQDDLDLTRFALRALSAETGLDFQNFDAWRLGDIELLVLPGKAEHGPLLVHQEAGTTGLTVHLQKPLATGACSYRISTRVFNDGAVVYSAATVLPEDAQYPATEKLAWPPQIAAIRDAITVEIEAQDAASGASWLCYQRGASIYREASQTSHVSAGGASFQNDWLERALRPAHKRRLEEAQQIARHTANITSRIGGRQADPWVTANRAVSAAVSNMLPLKSSGRFFLRVSEGENTGRLELAEWLRGLLAEHRDKHVIWFDPYMEDVGINLLNQYGSDSGSYTVITGSGKAESATWLDHYYAWTQGASADEDTPDRRILNLQGACAHWSERYGSVRLRVLGLSQEDLHDRMVLICDAHMRPVVGYHLSNSIQKANENYPLLITPIPLDVLRPVAEYSEALVRAAAKPKDGSSPAKLRTLFDSAEFVRPARRPYELDDVYSTPRAGDVLAWWLSDSTLSGLGGEVLKQRLESGGYLEDEQMRDAVFEQLPAGIWQQGLPLSDFNSAWDALGVVLCNTMAGDYIFEAPDASVPALRSALLGFLDSDRADAAQPVERGVTVDMTAELNTSLADYLRNAAEPQWRFPHEVVEVSWGDYYALKVLWATEPDAFVDWVEQGADGRFRSNRRRQLCLVRAARLVSFEVERHCTPRQLQALLASKNGLMRWIGYVAFETIALADPKALIPSGATSTLSYRDRLDLLGWLVARAARAALPAKTAFILELHASLPKRLDAAGLKQAVESMRDFLGRVYWSPPWMLQDALSPLVIAGRLDLDTLATQWFDELFNCWTAPDDNKSLIFSADSEGLFTDEVAQLCAHASSKAGSSILKKLSKEVIANARIVQRPFAEKENFSANERAFKVLLWIAGFTRAWVGQAARPCQAEAALVPAEAALQRRSELDWARSGLAAFLRYKYSKELA